MIRLILLTLLGMSVASASVPGDLHNVTSDTSQTRTIPNNEAEAIIDKAVQKLGGDRYLKVTSQVSRGKFSVIRDGVIVSFQSFIDVIVYPDKERTEFKGNKN